MPLFGGFPMQHLGILGALDTPPDTWLGKPDGLKLRSEMGCYSDPGELGITQNTPHPNLETSTSRYVLQPFKLSSQLLQSNLTVFTVRGNVMTVNFWGKNYSQIK